MGILLGGLGAGGGAALGVLAIRVVLAVGIRAPATSAIAASIPALLDPRDPCGMAKFFAAPGPYRASSEHDIMVQAHLGAVIRCDDQSSTEVGGGEDDVKKDGDHRQDGTCQVS